jgi:hypothetical protein
MSCYLMHSCVVVVNLDITTFHVLIMLSSHVIATLHSRAGSLGSSVWRAYYVPGALVLSHFLMSHSGQHTPVQHTLLIQCIIGTNVVLGKGAGATRSWIRFPVALGEVECPPFSWTQSRTNGENAADLATTHVHAFGHIVRCDTMFTSHAEYTSVILLCHCCCYILIFLLTLFFLICRMAQFHLLDPHYDEHHRGRLTTEREVIFCIYIKILN